MIWQLCWHALIETGWKYVIVKEVDNNKKRKHKIIYIGYSNNQLYTCVSGIKIYIFVRSGYVNRLSKLKWVEYSLNKQLNSWKSNAVTSKPLMVAKNDINWSHHWIVLWQVYEVIKNGCKNFKWVFHVHFSQLQSESRQ